MRTPRRNPRDARTPLAGLLPSVLGLVCLAYLVNTGSGAASAEGVPVPDQDVIVNGDFRSLDHMEPWRCSPLVAPVLDPATAEWQLRGAPAGADYGECHETVYVQPGSTYALTARVRGPFVFAGVTGTGGTDPSAWSSDPEWNVLATGFTAGPGTTSVTVWFHGWYGQDPFLVDWIQLIGPGRPGPSFTAHDPVSASASASSPAPSSGAPSPSASASASRTGTPTPTPTPGGPSPTGR
ncbi:hypothetical protein AB0O31_25155 [Kitasatospora cineracea]|uniref:hypothetical protein n=1 Tax=Kitasatospora cineracea TaxID=88074 RepID=UPI003424A825